MEHELQDFDFLKLIEDSGAGRSEGLHVSAIIKRIMRRLEPDRFNAGLPDPSRLGAGLAFERALEVELMKMDKTLLRRGEVTKDGIIGSPDGVCVLADGREAVHEYKFTWMSCRYGLNDDRFWHWRVQIMAYCHMLGTTEALLTAFFVNGDYRKLQPMTRHWRLSFTPGELEGNWDMLRSAAAEMSDDAISTSHEGGSEEAVHRG